VLILASASPRRRELLARLCRSFEVIPSEIEERLPPGDLRDAVAAVALDKARSVARKLARGVVLGADTVVVDEEGALGKPADREEASVMLRRLRGRMHDVITGLAVVAAPERRSASTAVVSRVLMTDYSDADIAAYVATGEPLDKAGAYAIQGVGRRLICGVVGSYSNVIGLPLAETRRLLAGFGVATDPPAAGEQRDHPTPG
jgi:septum formation protein